MTTIFLALRKSSRTYYEGGTDHDEGVIDADIDIDALRDKVNTHYARPEVMQYQRGQRLVIPSGAMESNEYFSDGGGCGYRMHLVLRPAPRLTK